MQGERLQKRHEKQQKRQDERLKKNARHRRELPRSREPQWHRL